MLLIAGVVVVVLASGAYAIRTRKPWTAASPLNQPANPPNSPTTDPVKRFIELVISESERGAWQWHYRPYPYKDWTGSGNLVGNCGCDVRWRIDYQRNDYAPDVKIAPSSATPNCADRDEHPMKVHLDRSRALGSYLQRLGTEHAEDSVNRLPGQRRSACGAVKVPIPTDGDRSWSAVWADTVTSGLQGIDWVWEDQ